MIFNKENLGQIKTASNVKWALKYDNHFFSPKTMKFFGDKMNSFGVKWHEGKRVLYRKPTAMVNVFGTWKVAGQEFSRIWEIVPMIDHVELKPLN